MFVYIRKDGTFWNGHAAWVRGVENAFRFPHPPSVRYSGPAIGHLMEWRVFWIGPR